MNQSLRTSIGIVALLLAATVSVNEVNAQSSFATNSGWNISQSRPLYGATAQAYPSAILSNRTYYQPQSFNQPQSYNQPQLNSSYWQPSQSSSWSPRYTQPNTLGVSQLQPQIQAQRQIQAQPQIQAQLQTQARPQIYREATFPQTPTVNLPTYAGRPANATLCQPGGT